MPGLLFLLPSVLASYVLGEWTSGKDLAKCDTACCNNEERYEFVQILSNRNFTVKDCVFFSESKINLLNWILLRGLNVESLMLKGSDFETQKWFAKDGIILERELTTLMNSHCKLRSILFVDFSFSYTGMGVEVKSSILNQMKSIEMADCEPLFIGQIVANFVTKCPNLTTFTCKTCHRSNDSVVSASILLRPLILSCHAIQNLYFDYSITINSIFLHVIATNLKHLKVLQFNTIYNTNNIGMLKVLTRILYVCKELEILKGEFYIYYENILNKQTQQKHKSIRLYTQTYENNHFDMLALFILVPDFRNILLHNAVINDDILYQIAKRNANTLKILRLHRNASNTSTVDALVQILRCKHLTTLSLDTSSMNSKKVFQLLAHNYDPQINKKLQYLNIISNYEYSIVELLAILDNNKHLQLLKLRIQRSDFRYLIAQYIEQNKLTIQINFCSYIYGVFDNHIAGWDSGDYGDKTLEEVIQEEEQDEFDELLFDSTDNDDENE